MMKIITFFALLVLAILSTGVVEGKPVFNDGHFEGLLANAETKSNKCEQWIDDTLRQEDVNLFELTQMMTSESNSGLLRQFLKNCVGSDSVLTNAVMQLAASRY